MTLTIDSAQPLKSLVSMSETNKKKSHLSDTDKKIEQKGFSKLLQGSQIAIQPTEWTPEKKSQWRDQLSKLWDKFQGNSCFNDLDWNNEMLFCDCLITELFLLIECLEIDRNIKNKIFKLVSLYIDCVNFHNACEPKLFHDILNSYRQGCLSTIIEIRAWIKSQEIVNKKIVSRLYSSLDLLHHLLECRDSELSVEIWFSANISLSLNYTAKKKPENIESCRKLTLDLLHLTEVLSRNFLSSEHAFFIQTLVQKILNLKGIIKGHLKKIEDEREVISLLYQLLDYLKALEPDPSDPMRHLIKPVITQINTIGCFVFHMHRQILTAQFLLREYCGPQEKNIIKSLFTNIQEAFYSFYSEKKEFYFEMFLKESEFYNIFKNAHEELSVIFDSEKKNCIFKNFESNVADFGNFYKIYRIFLQIQEKSFTYSKLVQDLVSSSKREFNALEEVFLNHFLDLTSEFRYLADAMWVVTYWQFPRSPEAEAACLKRRNDLYGYFDYPPHSNNFLNKNVRDEAKRQKRRECKKLAKIKKKNNNEKFKIGSQVIPTEQLSENNGTSNPPREPKEEQKIEVAHIPVPVQKKKVLTHEKKKSLPTVEKKVKERRELQEDPLQPLPDRGVKYGRVMRALMDVNWQPVHPLHGGSHQNFQHPVHTKISVSIVENNKKISHLSEKDKKIEQKGFSKLLQVAQTAIKPTEWTSEKKSQWRDELSKLWDKFHVNSCFNDFDWFNETPFGACFTNELFILIEHLKVDNEIKYNFYKYVLLYLNLLGYNTKLEPKEFDDILNTYNRSCLSTIVQIRVWVSQKIVNKIIASRLYSGLDLLHHLLECRDMELTLETLNSSHKFMSSKFITKRELEDIKSCGKLILDLLHVAEVLSRNFLSSEHADFIQSSVQKILNLKGIIKGHLNKVEDEREIISVLYQLGEYLNAIKSDSSDPGRHLIDSTVSQIYSAYVFVFYMHRQILTAQFLLRECCGPQEKKIINSLFINLQEAFYNFYTERRIILFEHFLNENESFNFIWVAYRELKAIFDFEKRSCTFKNFGNTTVAFENFFEIFIIFTEIEVCTFTYSRFLQDLKSSPNLEFNTHEELFLNQFLDLMHEFRILTDAMWVVTYGQFPRSPEDEAANLKRRNDLYGSFDYSSNSNDYLNKNVRNETRGKKRRERKKRAKTLKKSNTEIIAGSPVNTAEHLPEVDESIPEAKDLEEYFRCLGDLNESSHTEVKEETLRELKIGSPVISTEQLSEKNKLPNPPVESKEEQKLEVAHLSVPVQKKKVLTQEKKKSLPTVEKKVKERRELQEDPLQSLPDRGVKYGRVMRALMDLNWQPDPELNGSHQFFRHPAYPRGLIVLPKHTTIKTGTMHSIKAAAKLALQS